MMMKRNKYGGNEKSQEELQIPIIKKKKKKIVI